VLVARKPENATLSVQNHFIGGTWRTPKPKFFGRSDESKSHSSDLLGNLNIDENLLVNVRPLTLHLLPVPLTIRSIPV
jgi:hypothetical protein